MNDIDHQEEEREITIHHQINALRDEADAMVRMDQSVKKAFILSTIKELESELIDDCNLAPEEQEIEDAPFYPRSEECDSDGREDPYCESYYSS